MKQEGFINERTNNKEFDIKEQTENRETKIFTRTLKLILRNDSSILRTNFFFALWITKANSDLKVYMHLWIEGASFLKIQEFLSVQILQHIMMIIFIAKGRIQRSFDSSCCSLSL
jgi:hypothetical protein